MHSRNEPLSHTTPTLILIRVGIHHKDGKALPHNITAFLGSNSKPRDKIGESQSSHMNVW